MIRTLNDLIADPEYYVHHTERRFGYYSVHKPGIPVRYTGIYGKGYRVFLPIHVPNKEDGVFIQYWLKREVKNHD